jgi:ubiquinone/menaquinone biosynthesis C-methylase UbiE
MNKKDAEFAGSIPATYDKYLGPLFFEPYAEDLAARLHPSENSSVLELACGTGILTRILRDRLPRSVALTATDLNEPMMHHAAGKFTGTEAVVWKQADACSLPFPDEVFDAVICQFGFMFVPDKALCAREARRVLRPGGAFLFNVWDSLAVNPLGKIPHETITRYFEKDPPTFYQVPFGYYDQAEMKRVLEGAGFRDVRIEVVSKNSGSSRVEDAAVGLVQGTPVSVAIAERDASLLPVITEAVARALEKQFGGPSFSAPMRAIVVEARR